MADLDEEIVKKSSSDELSSSCPPRPLEETPLMAEPSTERTIPVVSHINPPTIQDVSPLPRMVRRRIPSPVFVPSYNYTDKAFFGGLIMVTIASFVTRLYKLGEPTHVA